MYNGLPNHQRLWLVKQRNAELIHQAAQERLVRPHSGIPADRRPSRPFRTARAALAQVFTRIRSVLPGYSAPCDDLCPDGAVC